MRVAWLLSIAIVLAAFILASAPVIHAWLMPLTRPAIR